MATKKPPEWLIPKSSLPIGTKVRFLFGTAYREATIIEDRGVIRRGLRHLYRIEFANGEETISFELPDAEFEVIESVAHAA